MALPAKKPEPEPFEERASLRAKKALKKVGTKKTEKPSGRPHLARSADAPKPAESASPSGPKPRPNLRAVPNAAPSPKRPAEGAPGPQTITSLSAVAMQLHAAQAADRFREGGATASMSEDEAPAFTGGTERAFLEPEVRSYTLPEESEEELEKKRQESMVRQEALAFGETAEELRHIHEEAAPEPEPPPLPTPPEVYRLQLREQAALLEAQMEENRETEEEQELATATTESEQQLEKLRNTQQIQRLVTEAFAVETVIGGLALIGELNIIAIKQHLFPKSEFFMYHKTSRISLALDATALGVDVLLVLGLFMTIAVPLIIGVVILFPALHLFSWTMDLFRGIVALFS